MNVNIKQKLAGKSAYIALGLLMALIVLFTVIAIVAAVNDKDEAPLPPSDANNAGAEGEGGGEQDVPSGAEPDETPSGGDQTEPDVPSGGEEEPEAPVYVSPCDGAIQKDYSEEVLVFSQTMNDHRIHLGVDIAGKVGDPVKAFAGGTVERIYNDRFMGNTVIIDHGNGLKSLYMNLAAEMPDGIREGAAVQAGTVIGAIGESAISECADSPHLHFEIRLNDKRVDPKDHVTLPSSATPDDGYEG